MNDAEQHGLRPLAAFEPPVRSPIEAKDVLLALALAEHEAVRADSPERAGLVAAQRIVRELAGIGNLDI
jgi:hypothetical protein